MIDLHTHTFLSDGALIPAELARRAEDKGLTAIGMTDHGDPANLDFIVPRLAAVAAAINPHMRITVIPGVEITHTPPALIAETAARARALGAKLVVVHGETLVEPVAPGTNEAAVDAGVDVLAHPGLITEALMKKAARNNVFIEISGRKGHSLANGLIAGLAEKTGATLVINSDAHAPGDLIDLDQARRIVLGAGLTDTHFTRMQEAAARFL